MRIKITKKEHDHNYKSVKRHFLFGRVMFGIGAVISGLMSIVVFRELVETQSK